MKLGLNSVLFGAWDMETAFKYTAMAGYDGIEVAAIGGMSQHLVLDNWHETAREARRLGREYGLELLAMEQPRQDPDTMEKAFQAANEAGIPVVTINSGNDVAEALGVLIHVGQTEYEAGFGGGERMAAAGVKKAFCVNQEVGNLSLDRRCQGFADAMEAAGAVVEVLAVELADPTESQQRIQAALSANPDIDGLMTLGPTGALPALQALREEDKLGQIQFATFDVAPEILAAIEAGEMLFAIDQQQYLQGYLPVVLLALYRRNENTLANDVVRTGPGFITSENVVRLKDLTRQGTR